MRHRSLLAAVTLKMGLILCHNDKGLTGIENLQLSEHIFPKIMLILINPLNAADSIKPSDQAGDVLTEYGLSTKRFS